MTLPRDWTALPDGLPVPHDDGAARHLLGCKLPSLTLSATDGSRIDLSSLPGRNVVYVYPRTGQPGQPNLGAGTQSRVRAAARRRVVDFAITSPN